MGSANHGSSQREKRVPSTRLRFCHDKLLPPLMQNICTYFHLTDVDGEQDMRLLWLLPKSECSDALRQILPAFPFLFVQRLVEILAFHGADLETLSGTFLHIKRKVSLAVRYDPQ